MEYAYREDDCANVVVEASCADGLLVSPRRTSLLRQHKPSADPYTRRTKCKSGSKTLSIIQTTRSNDLDVLLGEWALYAAAQRRHSGNQYRRWHVAGVSTTLATLCADDIDAQIKALLDVLGMSNHVHIEDAMRVQLVDDLLWWDADGGDEELSAGVDDDVDQFAELALGVVVAASTTLVAAFPVLVLISSYLVFRALPPTCGSSRSTPNGAFLSLRSAFNSAICSLSMSGV